MTLMKVLVSAGDNLLRQVVPQGHTVDYEEHWSKIHSSKSVWERLGLDLKENSKLNFLTAVFF